MQVEIREIKPRKAVCVSHRGRYEEICHAFDKLFVWLKETGTQAGMGVALYYDNPRVTPADELRSAAGVFVPDDFVTDDARVHIVEIAGGAYAVGTHIGSYDGIANAWRELVDGWLPSSDYAMGDAPCVEVYVDDCTQVPQAQLRTELYTPIKTPALSLA